MAKAEAAPMAVAGSRWPSALRWIPTSAGSIAAAEKRLLSLVKTGYVQEQVNIGFAPLGAKARWFKSSSEEPRFINTVTFDSGNENAPTLVMVHGYGASQGLFFRNYDSLASRFRVIAIDQLGVECCLPFAVGADQADQTSYVNALKCVRASRDLSLTMNLTNETDCGGSRNYTIEFVFSIRIQQEADAWFIDSFEEWRKAKNLHNFILLGHSLGGYVAAKYALQHPEHVQHLILVGPAGFSPEGDDSVGRLAKFRATWKGMLVNHLWESNFTPRKILRGLGPWGPYLVRRYTNTRFGSYSTGELLTKDESILLTDYIYHTLVAKASGELCLNYIFSLGAFARKPLMQSASDWKVSTTFIYGHDDWMSYQGAQQARKDMTVPCEIIRVPHGGHLEFIENPSGFNSAVLYACRNFLSAHVGDNLSRPDGLIFA